MHVNNLYQILGVSHSANKQTIRRAYIQLAKKYHPDNSTSQTTTQQLVNEELFKQITNAYDTLGDDEKRRRYNMTLMLASVDEHDDGEPTYMRGRRQQRQQDQHSRFYAAMKQQMHEAGFAEPDGVTEEFMEHERRVARRRKMSRHMLLVVVALYIIYRFSVYVMLVKRREKEKKEEKMVTSRVTPVD